MGLADKIHSMVQGEKNESASQSTGKSKLPIIILVVLLVILLFVCINSSMKAKQMQHNLEALQSREYIVARQTVPLYNDKEKEIGELPTFAFFYGLETRGNYMKISYDEKEYLIKYYDYEKLLRGSGEESTDSNLVVTTYATTLFSLNKNTIGELPEYSIIKGIEQYEDEYMKISYRGDEFHIMYKDYEQFRNYDPEAKKNNNYLSSTQVVVLYDEEEAKVGKLPKNCVFKVKDNKGDFVRIEYDGDEYFIKYNDYEKMRLKANKAIIPLKQTKQKDAE